MGKWAGERSNSHSPSATATSAASLAVPKKAWNQLKEFGYVIPAMGTGFRGGRRSTDDESSFGGGLRHSIGLRVSPIVAFMTESINKLVAHIRRTLYDLGRPTDGVAYEYAS
jgi:hypothetical protein